MADIDLLNLPKSREEAISRNAKMFLHTKGCRKGHPPVRFTSNNRCAICVRKGKRAYFLKNKTKIYKSLVKRQKIRYREDPVFKAAALLRDQVKRLFRTIKSSKNKSTTECLGYSVEDFMAHMESLFHSGMAWSNHSYYWELDHIVPVGAFDLTKIEHFNYVNCLENLQPLLLEDHKNKTLEDVMQINEFRDSGVRPDKWAIIDDL